MATDTNFDSSQGSQGRNTRFRKKTAGGRRRQKNTGSNRSIIIREIVASKILKYFDSYLSSTTSTTVGYVDLTAIALGSTTITRNSDTIRIVEIQFGFELDAANADVFGKSRVGLFIWKQDTAAVTPGTFSFYQDSSSYGVVTPEQYANRLKYRKLKDKLLEYAGTSTAPTSKSILKFHYNNKFKGYGLRVMYTAAATTGYSHIYFVNFGDSSIAPHPNYEMMSRVWFYDA